MKNVHSPCDQHDAVGGDALITMHYLKCIPIYIGSDVRRISGLKPFYSNYQNCKNKSKNFFANSYLRSAAAPNVYSCTEDNMDISIKIEKNHLTNFSILVI